MLSEVGDALWDALGWSGDNLAAPIATGVAVGLALRAVAIPREIANHYARAEEIQADLIRWVRDRTQQLQAEISRALNFARAGVIEDAEAPGPLPGLPPGGKPGDQSIQPAFVRRIERLMRHALHEYRDEASRKAREYRAMARSEGHVHRLMRRARRQPSPPALKLPKDALDDLATWRERPVPVSTIETPASVGEDDPTKLDDAADIAPLETAAGLTWAEGRKWLDSDRASE